MTFTQPLTLVASTPSVGKHDGKKTSNDGAADLNSNWTNGRRSASGTGAAMAATSVGTDQGRTSRRHPEDDEEGDDGFIVTQCPSLALPTAQLGENEEDLVVTPLCQPLSLHPSKLVSHRVSHSSSRFTNPKTYMSRPCPLLPEVNAREYKFDENTFV